METGINIYVYDIPVRKSVYEGTILVYLCMLYSILVYADRWGPTQRNGRLEFGQLFFTVQT